MFTILHDSYSRSSLIVAGIVYDQTDFKVTLLRACFLNTAIIFELQKVTLLNRYCACIARK